ncbi:MAG: hypothetical protein AAFX06_33305, partial [Planctomycetota bacterium]
MPMLAFSSEQKSGEEEQIPVTPMDGKYLRSTAAEEGFACRMARAQGPHKTSDRLGRIIADTGRAAKIVVKIDAAKMGATKYASRYCQLL